MKIYIWIGLFGLLTGCANTVDPAPPVTTNTTQQTSDEEPAVINDESTGDKSEIAMEDYDGSGQIIPTSQCSSDCTADCTSEKEDCLKEGATYEGSTTPSANVVEQCAEEQTACVAACSSNSFEDGGCNSEKIGGPAGDSTVKVPGGAKTANVELRHCTHHQDVLTIQSGVMSFLSTKGVKNPGKNKSSSRIWHRHLPPYSSGSSGRVDGHVPFASVGNDKGAEGDQKLQDRLALVTIDGKEFEWPYPEAIPFNLGQKIGNVDPTKPTALVREKVTLEGDNKSQKKKAARWTHFNNHYGDLSHLDIMTYTRKPFWKETKRSAIGLLYRSKTVMYHPTNCDFTTEFKFYYFPRQ